MIKYVNDQEINEIINLNNDLILVFVKGINCSVCHAVENRVNNNLIKKFPNLKVYYITMENSPKFRGQHLIFAVPTLILLDRQKEVLRESRIIDFTKLERILSLYFN